MFLVRTLISLQDKFSEGIDISSSHTSCGRGRAVVVVVVVIVVIVAVVVVAAVVVAIVVVAVVQ